MSNLATPVRLTFFSWPSTSEACEAAVLVSLLVALKELKAVPRL